MPKTSNTPNKTLSKPAKTQRVHKPKKQRRRRCFVSRQCSGSVPNMTIMRWMPAKIILNFPGRERCLQNDCWKDTSTRFNITQSYLVGKFNRKEIYSGWNLFSGDLLSLQRWQQTCGGSHLWHQIDFEVNSMVEIFGNANFVQRCESCCDMEKKCDILILTTMSRSAGLWTESWLFGIPGPATRYRLTVSLLSCVLETEDFMLHDIGDPPEVCVGDDLCLLAKRQPGRVRGHGQHAHHVQHQQQVWHQNQVILWTGFNIKSNTTFSSSKKNRVTSILQFLSAGMPAEWRSLSER